MRTTTMTSEGVLPFIPESVSPSGKLGSDSFVGREGASGYASAGRSLRRSNALCYPLKASAIPTSPINLPPAKPVLLDVAALENIYGVHSPLDELMLRLNDAGAVLCDAYPQDNLAFKHPPIPHRPGGQTVVQYCAGHDNDDVPTIPAVDFRHCQHISSEFEFLLNYQDGSDLKYSQAQAVCHSQESTALQLSNEHDAPVLGGECLQAPPVLKRSPAIRRRVREVRNQGQQRRTKRSRHVAASPLILARLVEKLFSRLRNRLSRTAP